MRVPYPNPHQQNQLQLRATDVAKHFYRDSRGRYKTLVAAWSPTPYGELSQGLFWEAHRAWRTHLRLARLWTTWHYGLGVLAVALAAFSGFGGLSKLLGYQQAAFVAIGSGIATGLVTFLKSDEHRHQHQELAAAWDNLRDDVTTLYKTQPSAKETQQDQANAGQTDPNGWRTVMEALMERAKSLRAGKATSEPSAAWPPSKKHSRETL
jgi:hypothetical protein